MFNNSRTGGKPITCPQLAITKVFWHRWSILFATMFFSWQRQWYCKSTHAHINYFFFFTITKFFHIGWLHLRGDHDKDDFQVENVASTLENLKCREKEVTFHHIDHKQYQIIVWWIIIFQGTLGQHCQYSGSKCSCDRWALSPTPLIPDVFSLRNLKHRDYRIQPFIYWVSIGVGATYLTI